MVKEGGLESVVTSPKKQVSRWREIQELASPFHILPKLISKSHQIIHIINISNILKISNVSYIYIPFPYSITTTIMSSDAEYKNLPEETLTSSELPSGTDTTDNSYTSRTGQYQIPVQKDEMPVEDPINPATADSDATLGESKKFFNSIQNWWRCWKCWKLVVIYVGI